MKWRKLLSLISGAIVVGTIGGVIFALIEVVSQRYLPYRMYLLALLTFQETLNRSLLMGGGAIFLGGLIIILLPSRRGFRRNGILVAIILAGFLFLNFLLIEYRDQTIFSTSEHILTRIGNLVNGIISPAYFFRLSAKYPGALLPFLGGFLLLVWLTGLSGRINWKYSNRIYNSKALKITAGILLLGTLLLNGAARFYRNSLTPPGPNVILIVVDTLRADHLGCYGYNRDTTPHLDMLAGNSYLFRNAISPAPWTSPAFAAIFTSCYPKVLGFTDDPPVRIDDGFVTLPELFKNKFYRTAGIISHLNISYKLGFNQGFDSYNEENARGHSYVSSPAITRRAISFLKRHRDKKFFLFLHYFDPHSSYILHPGYNYLPDYSGSLRGGEAIDSLLRKAPSFSPNDLKFVKSLYDSEISFTDGYIGKVLQALKDLKLYDRSLIIFTADHGEEFLERGDHWIGHTKHLYQELIHVPLLIKLPGDREGKIIDPPVGLIDLMPTIAAAAGIDLPADYHHNGKQIILDESREPRREAIISETTRLAKLQSVIQDNWKLIAAPDMPSVRLFDLKNDPGEKVNLAGSNPLQLRKLSAILSRWRGSVQASVRAGKPARPVRFNRQQQKKLRALGYAQ